MACGSGRPLSEHNSRRHRDDPRKLLIPNFPMADCTTSRKRSKTSVSAAAVASPPALSDEWLRWASDFERASVALFTVCALYQQREVATTLSAVQSAAEHMSQIRLSDAAVALLAELYGEAVVQQLPPRHSRSHHLAHHPICPLCSHPI